MNSKEITFGRLIESPKFRQLYQLMSEAIGIKLLLVDPAGDGKALLSHKQNPPLCRLLRRHHAFDQCCCRCDCEHLNLARKTGESEWYRCHAGLIDLVVPIVIDHRPVAIFLGGQLLPEPPTPARFEKFFAPLVEAGYDRAEVRRGYFRTMWMSPARLRNLTAWISLFAEHFYELGSRLLPPPHVETLSARAVHWMEAHYTEELTQPGISAALGVSSVYFSSKFKEETGENYIDFLRRLRIEKAGKLLSNTTYSVSRIAMESGFGSLTSFNRNFRQKTGISPRQYRKSPECNMNKVM